MLKDQVRLRIIKKDMKSMQELQEKKWIFKLKDLTFYYKKVYN